jgi:hypothetical protein
MLSSWSPRHKEVRVSSKEVNFRSLAPVQAGFESLPERNLLPPAFLIRASFNQFCLLLSNDESVSLS